MIKKISFILFLFSYLLYANSEYTLLGNPYVSKYKSEEHIYARNIWDMQLYNSKIYLGAGNSSNKGPAQNAGRVYVVSLNPKTDKFSYEYKVAEEQIDTIKVYGDTLYIPGHDATQKWTFGNIYSKEDKKWTKHRTLPKALHVYDLVVKDNKIFTAIGLNKKGAVFISDKKAKVWDKISHGSGRVYSFLEVGDELYATKTFKIKYKNKLSVTQWLKDRNTFSSRYDLNVYKMFPNTFLRKYSIKIIKPIKFKDNAFYIGAYKHNDHQNEPFGLYQAYIKNSKLKVKKLKLESDFIPRDIIKRKDNIYILATKKINKYSEIKVLKLNKNNLSEYNVIISFKYPTFARSFEKYKDCFYFGMGSEVKSSKNWKQKELKKQTGDILKVCNK